MSEFFSDKFLLGWLNSLTDDQRVKALKALDNEQREKALQLLGDQASDEKPDVTIEAARKAAGLTEKKGDDAP